MGSKTALLKCVLYTVSAFEWQISCLESIFHIQWFLLSLGHQSEHTTVNFLFLFFLLHILMKIIRVIQYVPFPAFGASSFHLIPLKGPARQLFIGFKSLIFSFMEVNRSTNQFWNVCEMAFHSFSLSTSKSLSSLKAQNPSCH